MSIFIDKTALFPVCIKFISILNDNAKVIASKIISDDSEEENVKF